MRKGTKMRACALLMVMCLALGGCGKDNSKQEPDANDEITATVVTDTPVDNGTGKVTDAPASEPEKKYEGSTMTFDTSVEHQKWDGFGAAYTWYGDRLLNAQNSEEGLDYLFTDAKLTILRFKNEYEYSFEDKATNATAMARNYKAARDRAALYGERVQVLLCCWSPPAKLKSDDTIATGYGTLKKDENGNYVYKEYADWWAESVEYYRSKGIQIDYVSIQNEVDFSPSDYEGCRFDAKESNNYAGYAEAFCAVYDAFKEKFGDDAPVLLGPETMGCDPGLILKYYNAIIEINPEALGGLAFHLYASGESSDVNNTVKTAAYLTAFTNLRDKYSDLRKWQTEFWIGKGIQYAELIWSSITNAEMSAYLFWSGVWDDSTPDNFESADLIEVNSSGVWRPGSRYYVMRHYSEFIRPGYVRIDAESDAAGVKVCAFTNDNRSKVAAVLVNKSDKDVEYRITGTDYTVTGSDVYQSVFGETATFDSPMYQSLGSLGEGGTLTLPAYSVTSVDITGYSGSTEVKVPGVQVITYEPGILEDASLAAVPEYDVTILDNDFSEDEEAKAYTNFGSSIARRVADGGEDGTGCMIIKMRQETWNGASIASTYFEHYGYLIKISYDCMMEEDGRTVSLTSTFTSNGGTYYPDGEKNRVAVYNMEGGKWYHAEGYATMYSNMSPDSFSLYWESPDNTDDIYIDNVKVTILYTEPVGEYEP